VSDLDRLQGTWTISALQVDGQKLSGSGGKIEIKGDRFVSTGMGADYNGKLVLDASAKPRRIDMKFESGPPKGKTNLGIYELAGDTWKLCIATRGDARPAKFASPADSGIALETLKRGDLAVESKPKVSKPAESIARDAPATEWEGEWRMLSGVMDGKPMEESLVKWVKRVTIGNQTTVLAGPNVMMKAEFSIDPSKSPAVVDYLNLAGSLKGKKQPGIYEIKGNVLTVSIAAPGAPRPKTFDPGRGITLTVWQRG
jgi:uncharacterized protein (TIGR03067 family)